MNRCIFAVAVVVAVQSYSVGCGEGCYEYNGSCACDAVPEKAVQTTMPSTDAVPQDKMPSYERAGIHADMPKSMAGKDALADQERSQADESGKASAGIH